MGRGDRVVVLDDLTGRRGNLAGDLGGPGFRLETESVVDGKLVETSSMTARRCACKGVL